ncbi:hypothetical protein ZWY2020_028154 [Hordeum vulgare]|nr:hypothetical protein ZWY2020_028154 [Hordeum vulgare]
MARVRPSCRCCRHRTWPTHTNEVFARIRLAPLGDTDADGNVQDDAAVAADGEQEKPASFAKTLTQSDANNGGGFSVPRYCAETMAGVSFIRGAYAQSNEVVQ